MFKKIHFKIQYLNSFIKKNYFFFIIGAVLIIPTVFLRRQIVSFLKLPIFQVQIVGIDGLYTIDKLPEEISNKISYGLTVKNENDKPSISPIVESLTIEDNRKNYIFTLKDNIYWHNGKKLTSNDINYQIPGITITPLANNQVKISLETEFSPVLSVLSQNLFKKKTIGLGQYKVKSNTFQDGYLKTLKLNPISKDLPRLYYRFYSSETDLINAYKLGDVDQIKITSLPSELSKWTNTKITQKIETNQKYSAIFFNTKKINNKQLRQALAYATTKTTDKNERCLGPISPNSWAYNSGIKEYNYNPTRAKELFKGNEIKSINLIVNNRQLLPMAEEIKHSWESILNLKTTITIETQIDLNNFDVILTYGSIPSDPDQYTFWHSTQTKTNLTKLDNSRIDKLLEEGRLALDQQERKQIYQDFQRYLLEESPAIFLSYPNIYTINRQK